MAIKSKRTFDIEREITFPCMGKFSNGNIVIMTSYSEGTIIYSSNEEHRPIGTQLKNVDGDSWHPYYGSVFIEWED